MIEPEIAAEDLLVPVGALGADDDGIAVGRNLERGKADGVEEFVEGELGFALGRDERGHNSRTSATTKAVFWIRIGSRWEEGLYNGGFVRGKFVTRELRRSTPQHPQQRRESRDGELKVSPSGQRPNSGKTNAR